MNPLWFVLPVISVPTLVTGLILFWPVRCDRWDQWDEYRRAKGALKGAEQRTRSVFPTPRSARPSPEVKRAILRKLIRRVS